MPQIAKFTVETKLLDNFSIEVLCGNHLVKMDQPKDGGGNGTGPCPVEYLLAALSGCVASMFRFVAMQKGIELKGLSINTNGQLDAEGLFGINNSVRPGLDAVTLDITIDAEVSDTEKENLTEEVIQRCPSWDNLKNTSPLRYNLI